MPEFATAEDYVRFRVFVQRVDEGAATVYELVDRFRTQTDKVVEQFAEQADADTACVLVRAKRVAEVTA